MVALCRAPRGRPGSSGLAALATLTPNSAAVARQVRPLAFGFPAVEGLIDSTTRKTALLKNDPNRAKTCLRSVAGVLLRTDLSQWYLRSATAPQATECLGFR
jgi:hypothetical protein